MTALAHEIARQTSPTLGMTGPDIEISGLVKRFGRMEVLRGVNVRIASGRVTAVVGPNGAGKSTLIKTILGLTRANAGTIRIGGRPVAGDDTYRTRIGYMPQIVRFPYNLTGTELVTMLTDLRGTARSDARVDEELIERFHLSTELKKPLRDLSGGTRQRVNAVVAFLFRAALLILDEPTAGLDPLSSGVLKDKILADRSDGRTIVLTSHIIGDLQELADDVVFLLEGKVVFAGAVNELLDRTGQRSLERAIARLMNDGVSTGEPHNARS